MGMDFARASQTRFSVLDSTTAEDNLSSPANNNLGVYLPPYITIKVLV
jgi:hypothetical protein